jgi:hypothetical protein
MKLKDIFDKIPREQDVIFYIEYLEFNDKGEVKRVWEPEYEMENYQYYKDFSVVSIQVDKEDKDFLAIYLTNYFYF